MTTNIYLGIDMGSSSLKALALDADSGRTMALARAALPHDRRPGGGCLLYTSDAADDICSV